MNATQLEAHFREMTAKDRARFRVVYVKVMAPHFCFGVPYTREQIYDGARETFKRLGWSKRFAKCDEGGCELCNRALENESAWWEARAREKREHRALLTARRDRELDERARRDRLRARIDAEDVRFRWAEICDAAKLSTRQKAALENRFVWGWTFREMADVEGVSTIRVRQVSDAAVRKLRDWALRA